MAWKNISDGTLVFPSGRRVAPGDSFVTKQARGVQLRALERGRAIKWTGETPKKGKPYG